MTDLTANTEAEVVDIVRAAREWKSPLNIVGARTKRAFGRAVAGWGSVLDLSGLKGIVSYEPEELLLTVLPGTPVTEINALLAASNQRLGFEPADWGPLLGAPANKATIGGVISANANGPAAIRFGRARDHLLGFRAVNGFGEAYKGGGKVVKNVTGFDLPKLMCGAMGTLGPLTELTFRVFPQEETSKIFAVGGMTVEDGLSLLRKIWSSPLEATCLALLSSEAWRYVLQIDRTEVERLGGDDDDDEWLINDCAAVIQLEGSQSVIAEREALLRTVCSEYHPAEIQHGTEVLRLIASGTSFVDSMEDVWLFSVPHTSALDLVGRLNTVWIADWAGGRVWERGTPGYSGEWNRNLAARCGGTATLIRASDETRKRVDVFMPEPPARAALTRAVKAAFDPLGLFNPGRMYEGV